MNSSTLWQDFRQTFKRNDSVLYQLILANVMVFMFVNLYRLMLFLGQLHNDPYEFTQFLAMPSGIQNLLTHPWAPMTYMFLHVELWHLVFNLLWFYWFGKILTEFIGSKRLLPLYLMGGLTGAAFYFGAYQLFPAFSTARDSSHVLGASASVLAIVIAAATLVPNYTVFIMFLGGIKIKWIALVLVVLDVISIPVDNPGGHVAHLGGAMLGFLFIKQLQRGNDFTSGLVKLFDWIANKFSDRPSLKVSSVQKEDLKKKDEAASKQEKIDKLLDKIAASGYASLTAEEKEFLFRYSKDES